MISFCMKLNTGQKWVEVVSPAFFTPPNQPCFMTQWFSITANGSEFKSSCGQKYLWLLPKILLFLEMLVTRKIFTRQPQI